MQQDELDKLIKIEFGPYDERAARRAIESFVDLFLSAHRNRLARAERECGEVPHEKGHETP